LIKDTHLVENKVPFLLRDFNANAMRSPLVKQLPLTDVNSCLHVITRSRVSVSYRCFQLEAFRLLRVLVKLDLWLITLESLVVKEDIRCDDVFQLLFLSFFDLKIGFFSTNYFQKHASHCTHHLLLIRHLFLSHPFININIKKIS